MVRRKHNGAISMRIIGFFSAQIMYSSFKFIALNKSDMNTIYLTIVFSFITIGQFQQFILKMNK